MSLYANVRSLIPGTVIDVGWNRELHTYFAHAYEGTQPSDAVFNAGDDEPFELRTLSALLDATWTLVDWSAERETLAALRDDPLNEDRTFRMQEAETFLRGETREDLRNLLMGAMNNAPWAPRHSRPDVVGFDPSRKRR